MPRWPTAMVTGASSGIGRAIAVRLAADGTDLVVVARRKDRLEALAEELTATHGVSVDVLAADVTDPAQLAAVEERLRSGRPPVDLLVNNAGVGAQGAFADIPIDFQESQIRLNVLAPVRLSHAALEGMVGRGRGGILNVSSIAGLQPMPNVATYAATKAYLSSFSHALHEEVRHRGVAVTALLPGFTRTEFHERMDVSQESAPSWMWLDADTLVTDALRDLEKGRTISVPSRRYKVLAGVAKYTPSSLQARFQGLGRK